MSEERKPKVGDVYSMLFEGGGYGGRYELTRVGRRVITWRTLGSKKKLGNNVTRPEFDDMFARKILRFEHNVFEERKKMSGISDAREPCEIVMSSVEDFKKAGTTVEADGEHHGKNIIFGETDDYEMVDHPPHYTFGAIEVIDAQEAWDLDYHEAQAVKYIARAKHKGTQVQDLRKAIWYLKRKVWLLTGGKEVNGEFDQSNF